MHKNIVELCVNWNMNATQIAIIKQLRLSGQMLTDLNQDVKRYPIDDCIVKLYDVISILEYHLPEINFGTIIE